MKKGLLFLVAILAVLAAGFVSCSDDDDEPEYYVRYTVGAQPGDEFFVSYLDKDGEKIVQQVSNDGKVEIVTGPVGAGFKAALGASVNGGHAPEYLQIDVSLSGRPFVRKVYQQNGVYIYYTITAEDR